MDGSLRYADVEVRTATGRIDMVMMPPDRLYIIELKIRDDAETASRRGNPCGGPDDRFALCGLPTVNVGVSFDCATRAIRDWSIS